MHVFLIALSIISAIADADLYESNGDYYFSIRESDSTAIENAILNYTLAANEDINIIYKLADAIDYKIVSVNSELNIKPFIDSLEGLYENDMPLSLAYTLMLLWGRYGESCGITAAIRYNIPNKIRNHALYIYENEKNYHDYAALLALGRLHYMTPNIPFLLTWPSLDKSLYFLEMFMDSAADTTPAIEYISDTKEKLEH